MMFRSQHHIYDVNYISSSIISLQVGCQVQEGTSSTSRDHIVFQVKYPTSSIMFEHFSFPSSIYSDLMPIIEPIHISSIYYKINITICVNDPHKTHNIDLLQDLKCFDNKVINDLFYQMIGNITIIK